MKTRFILVLGGALVSAAAIAVGSYIVYTWRLYDQAMRASPQAVRIEVGSQRSTVFDQEVAAGAWFAYSNHREDDFEVLLTSLGFPRSIDGIGAFYGCRRTAFRWFPVRANLRPAEIAVARAGLVPRTDDNVFHVRSDGRSGLLFLSSGPVVEHRDDAGGIISITYVKQRQTAEPGATDNPGYAQ